MAKLPRLLMRREGFENLPLVRLEFGYLLRIYREGDHEIWCEVTSGHTYDGWTPKKFLRGVLRSPRFDPQGLFFVTFGSRAAGTVCAWTGGRDKTTGVLRLLVVKGEHRGRGVGRFLAVKAMEYFRDHGLTACEIEVDRTRLAAIKLCLELGFRPVCADAGEWQRWEKVLRKLVAAAGTPA
jgi:ribosomal protein S18 acetylase RimI-like enzyme